MSLVVELFGGPGIGKTTFAAKLFAAVKDDKRFSVELVQEYVKTWAWEGREIKPADQIYLSAKQMRNESRLYDKVDVIITDAPILIGAYYAKKYCSRPLAFALLDLYNEIEPDAQRLRVYLNRVKDYDARGRFQTEAQARAVDEDLRNFIEGWSYIDVPASTEECVQIVLARAAEAAAR